MLSSGTRIGPFDVDSWIKEGSCGQSYKGEGRIGDEKGQINFLKLFHRDLSEQEGFSDYFSQECRAIQQLQGRGIWPIWKNGKMKWKHWIAYEWFDGKSHTIQTESGADNEEVEIISIRSLSDWMEFMPDRIGPDELKNIIIDLHCGLNLAHNAGVIHGNMKPSNILIQENESNSFVAWATEFALYKIVSFQSSFVKRENGSKFLSQSIQYQDSLKYSQQFRPAGKGVGDIAEESWDLFAMGQLVEYVIEKSHSSEKAWERWTAWSNKCKSGLFNTAIESMEAIPDVGDLSVYGFKGISTQKGVGLSDDEIRKKREIEWQTKQQISSAKFRRNITGLVGSLCVLVFLFSQLYLFFNPSPWTEYSIEGASDKYQLGFGIMSGKAWGILPSSYDHDGSGGQDVAGEWERENGNFRLNFRKFKKINEEESGKKLWQFIGKGATSDDDYFIWSDYLSYNHQTNSLQLIKRVDEKEVFVPGKREDGDIHLFPEVRIRRSGGQIKEEKLIFRQVNTDRPNWSLFIGLGFLVASLMYQRILSRIFPK